VWRPLSERADDGNGHSWAQGRPISSQSMGTLMTSFKANSM
jgi:hypothetical protein